MHIRFFLHVHAGIEKSEEDFSESPITLIVLEVAQLKFMNFLIGLK